MALISRASVPRMETLEIRGDLSGSVLPVRFYDISATTEWNNLRTLVRLIETNDEYKVHLAIKAL